MLRCLLFVDLVIRPHIRRTRKSRGPEEHVTLPERIQREPHRDVDKGIKILNIYNKL